MDALYPAHPITLITIVAAMLIVPLHLLATYVFSRADPRKGLTLAAAWTLFGAVMSAVCLWGSPADLRPFGALIVPLAWIAPSAILLSARRWALAQPLSQRWLIGLQLWRVIGAVFLIEMARGHIPAHFAYPAGLGDILAALLALAVLLAHRPNKEIPRAAVIAVAAVGIADFISAFFFGLTTAEGPLNLFPQDAPSRLIQFPTGMIPLFLVPYAIFFHTLSLLSLRAERKQVPAPPR